MFFLVGFGMVLWFSFTNETTLNDKTSYQQNPTELFVRFFLLLDLHGKFIYFKFLAFSITAP